MYKHAKTSFNNRANELKSDERKNAGSIEPNDEAGVAANNFAPGDQAGIAVEENTNLKAVLCSFLTVRI